MSEQSNITEEQRSSILDSEKFMAKVYSIAQGVWDERSVLPVILSEDGVELETPPLRIPLARGGSINLGTSEVKEAGRESVYLDVYIPKPQNMYSMAEFGTNITSILTQAGYDFWVYFDNERDPKQVKTMKFLANFRPVKDIDWDKIKARSDEMEVSLSMCIRAFEAQQRSRGKNHKSTGI